MDGWMGVVRGRSVVVVRGGGGGGGDALYFYFILIVLVLVPRLWLWRLIVAQRE